MEPSQKRSSVFRMLKERNEEMTSMKKKKEQNIMRKTPAQIKSEYKGSTEKNNQKSWE